MDIMGKVKHYEPGRAVGLVIKQADLTEGDAIELDSEPWAIEYVAEVRGAFEDENQLAIMGSDDGKNYKLLIGLYIDGERVNLDKYYGNL